MNDKKMYDLLNNSNIERLTEGKKVMTDAERERIFAMSKNKLNNMKRMAANNGSAEYVNSDYVNGVEKYNKPIITKFAGMAAAAVLLIGGIGGGALMAHHMNSNRPGDTDLPPAATNATTSAASYTSTAAKTYTTPANTVTTITEVDSTEASEQKHNTENSVQNSTSEAETTPKTTVKSTEAVIEPTTPAVSAEDQELIDAATRITDDYNTLFCLKHGWLSYDESDYLSLENQVVSSPIGGRPYYRVSDERFNTIEKIRAYITSHCTPNFSLYINVEQINDIDAVGELITENTEYKNLYRVSDDYLNLYFLKDGKLYETRGQLGLNFEGWCDQPVEIIRKSENEFVARRGHYTMEGWIYYHDYTFKKDPYTGSWLLDSDTPV